MKAPQKKADTPYGACRINLKVANYRLWWNTEPGH